MRYDIFDSPIGALTVATDGEAITELHIEGDRYFTSIPSGWVREAGNPVLIQARQELSAYFEGKRQVFEIPFRAQGTDFQKQVWKALEKVQSGSTTTYSEIAMKIGKPKAVRAVGTAIGKNPICVIVPCHRVLTRSGSLGGFVAGTERKQSLLALEHAI